MVAVYRLQPLSNGRRVLVACGPGNNGTSEYIVSYEHLLVLKTTQEGMALSLLVICGITGTNQPFITQSKHTMSCIKSVEPGQQIRGRSIDVEQRLATQLKNLNIPFTDDFQSALNNTNHVVDAIFGKRILEATCVVPLRLT